MNDSETDDPIAENNLAIKYSTETNPLLQKISSGDAITAGISPFLRPPRKIWRGSESMPQIWNYGVNDRRRKAFRWLRSIIEAAEILDQIWLSCPIFSALFLFFFLLLKLKRNYWVGIPSHPGLSEVVLFCKYIFLLLFIRIFWSFLNFVFLFSISS